MRFSRFLRVSCTILGLICGAAVFAADNTDAHVLVQGPQGAITAADVEADAQQRIPEEMRSSVLKQPKLVQQIATNLYVRRVMAKEAEQLHLDQSPEVRATLHLAREKVLSDAYLQHLDQENSVSDAAALAQARSTYEATGDKRFKAGERVRIRHILLQGTDDKTQAKARALIRELRAGADFAELARVNSIDKGTADKGGELGFFEHGRMVPEFEKAAFALKNIGDVSEPVVTKFGVHILQLEDRRPAGIQPFNEVQDTLVKEIRSKITQNARADAAQKLGEQAQPQMAAIEAFSSTYATSK